MATLQTAPATVVTGTVSYRERMALPPNAVVTVSLDRFGREGQVNLSELKLPLNGRQVPVTFVLPAPRVSKDLGTTYGLRAEIRAGDRILFETGSAAMVLSNGRYRADLVLVRALPMPTYLDQNWQLFQLDGQPLPAGVRPPTLRFVGKDGTLAGFGGVNRFGGRFVRGAGSAIQIDPGAMTMMAGPEPAMQLEQRLVALLPTVNRAEFFEGELTLMRGTKPLARFKKAAN